MKSKANSILFVSMMLISMTSVQAKVHDLISKVTGAEKIVSNLIVLKAPDIAENGAVVPVSIKELKIEKQGVTVTELWLFSDTHEKAVAHFKLGSNVSATGLGTRIKMAKSGTIYAVARLSDGSFISGKSSVKITIGGCGGGGPVSSSSNSSYPGRFQSALPPVKVNREKYASFKNNGVVICAEQPLSTFSIDVDTGSYSNIRRFVMKEGRMPHIDAVRVEEMLNYFDYAYPAPDNMDTPFAVHTEIGPAPWNNKTYLLRIGLKAYEKDNNSLPAANLVFLLDVSGSMAAADKLPLLINSMKMLTQQLREQDSISIVVYAGASGVVLPPTAGNHAEKIIQALDRLSAGGSTNGASGIQLAYSLAQQNYIKDGINRVILATDGDFNVGMTSQHELISLIEAKRKQGISLTTLGFGRGNYNEALMEQLADHGNGNYAYIDNFSEARKVLVEQMSGTLFTVARDVKIQVEFNPARVAEYRLIGYENRLLKKEDFRNDRVDAGEIGAGHSVTAMYEITLADEEFRYIAPLRYSQEKITGNNKELAMIKLRFKQGESEKSKKVEYIVDSAFVNRSLQSTSDDFRLAASVAAFGQWLRKTDNAREINLKELHKLARSAQGADQRGYRSEFTRLVATAMHISD